MEPNSLLIFSAGIRSATTEVHHHRSSIVMLAIKTAAIARIVIISISLKFRLLHYKQQPLKMSNVHGLFSNKDDDDSDDNEGNNLYVGGTDGRGGGRCVEFVCFDSTTCASRKGAPF